MGLHASLEWMRTFILHERWYCLGMLHFQTTDTIKLSQFTWCNISVFRQWTGIRKTLRKTFSGKRNGRDLRGSSTRGTLFLLLTDMQYMSFVYVRLQYGQSGWGNEFRNLCNVQIKADAVVLPRYDRLWDNILCVRSSLSLYGEQH